MSRSKTSTIQREARRRANEDLARLRQELGREPTAAEILRRAAEVSEDRRARSARSATNARAHELADLDSKMGIRTPQRVHVDGNRLVCPVMTSTEARAFARRDAERELAAHHQRYGGSR